MKVIVGMSGGVDSSVTAHLLKEQGYEVEGVSFILEERRLDKNPASSCCSLESVLDAGKTARRIGIPHHIVNLRDEFKERVIEPFVDVYSKGLTPNPCILCNKHIKFPYLLKFADERNAEFIATGHYARTVSSQQSAVSSQLRKGVDPKKDQSYVLYVLKREELDRLILPLGEKRKDEVRAIARDLNLPSAKRPESQEICFVGGRNYFRFLENLSEDKGGPIVELGTGNVLGSHKGIHLFTVGQRKRMGIATGKPLYVAKIDSLNNIVYVGSREKAMMKEFVVKDINWLLSRVRSKEYGVSSRDRGNRDGAYCLLPTPNVFRASVKVRSMMKDEPATITVLDEERVRVVYDEPQWAPAPGQSAVFYNGDVVIGGGVISGPVFKE